MVSNGLKTGWGGVKMKAPFSIVLLAFAIVTGIGAAAAQSPLPKEGVVAFSAVLHSTGLHQVSMGNDLSQSSYEVTGGTVAEKEGSLPDRMSMRCVGGGRIVKGKSEGETGMCEYIDVSDDKIFSTFSVSNGETPGTVASHHTVAGGTGKYTGITGNWVGTRRSLRSPVEGQVVAVIVYKGSYKLP
jgi:hypothetical protein